MDRLLQLGAGGMPGMGQVSAIEISSLLCLEIFLKEAHHHLQPPPGVDAPLMDTAEIVYISSLALLKVRIDFNSCS